VNVPTRKVDEEVSYYNIRDVTTPQASLAVSGASGMGKSFIINTIISYM
jgi:putative ribosome biogenesis GTPase RsgA